MSRSLLPPGVKLPPGTRVKITHSNCKGKQIHENATVLANGISIRSSLPPKILANMKVSWWNIYYAPPGFLHPIHYYSGVSTKSLLSKRYIALCKKSDVPVRERHRYANCDRGYAQSLAETINAPQDSPQPSSAKPQPSTSSAGQQEAAVPQPTSSN